MLFKQCLNQRRFIEAGFHYYTTVLFEVRLDPVCNPSVKIKAILSPIQGKTRFRISYLRCQGFNHRRRNVGRVG